MGDRASKALAEASLLGEPQTYDAKSKHSGVHLTTLYHRNMDGARRKRRPKGNSISLRRRRKLSKSI
jgi:hypothetical protein